MTDEIYDRPFNDNAPFQHPDTAPRKGRTYNLTGSRTSAAEVEKMVRNDISDGNLHLARTEEFLARLFPVDASIIDKAYEKLVASNHYDVAKKKWKGLPKAAKKERLYYKPFVNTAESIRVANTASDNITLSCRWIDRNSKAPKSRDKDASIIRPDILCILEMGKGEQEKWEALTNTKQEEREEAKEGGRETEGEEETKSKEEEGEEEEDEEEESEEEESEEEESEEEEREEEQQDKEKKDKKKQEKAMTAWWLRVNVPIEIKPKQSKDSLKHVEQLLGYMRQVLREQADRRFVPGLLLSRTGLQVWLCDRSGVLGTQKTIDIHKDPKSFIRIILACSLLPPERLGWDPTMRLCRQPINPRSPEFIHSYDPSIKLSDYHNSLYDTNWVIEMPSKAEPNKREEYITVRALSIVRAECMSGRATIVWAVIKVDDMKFRAPPHKIYVLKQCWRPTAGKHEGDFFPDESKTRDVHLGRIHSYEDVKRNGDVIDTQNFIRQGLDHFLPVVADVNPNGKRMNEALEEAEKKEVYLDIALTSDQVRVVASTRDSSPTWRTFARMLLEDYGWPMKNFRDLPELMTVSEQLLTTHRLLHFLGTLHRDISSGNALICLSNIDGVIKIEGRLIDLDYAKHVDHFIPPLLRQVKQVDKLLSKNPLKLDLAREIFEEQAEVKMSDEVIDALGSNYISSIYVAKTLNYKPHLRGTKLSGRDIGMLDEDQYLPDFSERVAQNRQRSATLPYASAEILRGFRMFCTDENAITVHNAVHDLEAFFWVLVSICITRGGPGGKRREELKPGTLSTPETQKLFLIVDCFFYTEKVTRLIYNKQQLFFRDQFEEYVLPHVHPYFEPLKPLLLRWWKILRIAYQYPKFEAIHDWFLDALRDTISVLKEHPPETDPRSADVDAFRERDLRSLQYFPNQDNTNRNSQGAMWDLSPSKDMSSRTSHDYLGNMVEQLPPQEPSSPTPASKKQRMKL